MVVLTTFNYPVVEIRRLQVKRKGISILKDINWCVKKNETWGVLGLNGSGKTTLLNVITGYEPFYKGEVVVCGKTFGSYDWRELRKAVGLVTSSLNYKIYSRITAEQMVYSGKDAMLNCFDKPTNADLQKANSVLELVGCQNLSKREWLTLSQGEKQRVLIARAFMSNYELLILDEPTVGLDPISRFSLIELLNDICKKADCPPIVYVTHHISEVFPSIGRVLLLKNGEVFAQGRKEKMLTSNNLSDVFDYDVRVSKSSGLYDLTIGGGSLERAVKS